MSRYVVHGAGAIGGTIGARLFEAGRDVVLIARGPHLEALQRGGLRYGDPERTRTLPIPAVGHPSEVEWRVDVVVLLATKSQHTDDALADLAATAPASIPLVCAQNGVENERRALRRFPNVYGMCVMLPATHVEPGAVDAVRDEAHACYDRAGIALPTPEEQAGRWGGAITMRPIPSRPRAAGSAWQSLARGTGNVETDYVNGEIVLLGRLHGVDTPVNAAVQRLANDAARWRLPPGSFTPADVDEARLRAKQEQLRAVGHDVASRVVNVGDRP